MRAVSRVSPWHVLSVLTAALGLSVVGCGSSEGPDLETLHEVSYAETLLVPAQGDSVLLALCTGWDAVLDREVKVYLDTQPSGDENLRLGLHVVGRAVDPDARAVVSYRWGGDTLFVWCNQSEPDTWEYYIPADKTSPVPPWLMTDRMDVAVPDGVNVRYIGRWWPQNVK